MTGFVWIETFAGKANPASWEALAAGRTLAEEFAIELTAVIFGENAETIAREAAQRGAQRSIVCDDEQVIEYRIEPHADLLTQLVHQYQPRFVMAVSSNRGRELLASSAVDCDSGLISDATELRVEDEKIVANRPAYAGKVLMTMTATSPTTYVTVRGRAFQPLPADSGAVTRNSQATSNCESSSSTVIEGFIAELGSVSLADAAIIVSGGRGMANNPKATPDDLAGEDPNVWKAKEGFANTIRPLADVLGAAIGASRAAVDAGYIPYEHQVGQTGKVVNPDLYIACGISGAIQHQAGMRGSKIIVAINKDADAPIFKLARYGIVGDLYEIVPALTDALRNKLG